MSGLEIVGAMGRPSPSAFLPGWEMNKNILCDKEWKEQGRSDLEMLLEIQADCWEEIPPWSKKAAPACLCSHGSEAGLSFRRCLGERSPLSLGSRSRTRFISLLSGRTLHLLHYPSVVVPLALAAKVCQPGASLRRLSRGPIALSPSSLKFI